MLIFFFNKRSLACSSNLGCAINSDNYILHTTKKTPKVSHCIRNLVFVRRKVFIINFLSQKLQMCMVLI